MEESGNRAEQIDYTKLIFGKAVERAQKAAAEKNNQAPHNAVKPEENSQKAYTNELEKLQKELGNLKIENKNIKIVAALEKAGCLNPKLVMKAVPEDCEDLQEWIEEFKNENDYLFKSPAQNHVSQFKPTKFRNLTTSEMMNNFIRGLY